MSTAESGPSRRALTIGLVLTVSMAAFEALAVATILPGTLRELGGLAYYGWAFTSFMLANVIGIPLSGRAADRRGPRLPFLIGLILFSAGLVVAGFARSMQILVLGRMLQGGGAAALSSVAYVALARAYLPAAQPRIMALLSSAWVVPGLVGPAMAASIANAAGWRAVFLGLVPLCWISGTLALVGLRDLAAPTVQPTDGSAPVRNATLLALAVAIGLLGLRSAQPMITGAALLGGAGLAGYAVRNLLPVDILRARPGLSSALWVIALVSLAFNAVEAFLPLALTEVRRVGASLVAATLSAGAVAWAGGAWVQAQAAGRLSRQRLLQIGLGLLLTGMMGASSLLWSAVPAPFCLVSWSIAGFGMGIAYQVATLAILEAAPSGREGSITAVMQIGNSLAVAIGAGLGGDLVNRLSRPGTVSPSGIAVTDAVALAACVIAMSLGRRVSESRAGSHGTRSNEWTPDQVAPPFTP